jgi:HlyD family secretion protein
VSDGDGGPRAVTLRLGLTDGAYTEVLSGELAEGASVIVGTAGDGGKTRAPASKGLRFGV